MLLLDGSGRLCSICILASQFWQHQQRLEQYQAAQARSWTPSTLKSPSSPTSASTSKASQTPIPSTYDDRPLVKRLDSLVIRKSHMSLTKSDGVFTFTNPIKDFQVFFGNTSFREIHFDCLDTDIGRSGWDIKLGRDVG